MTPLPPPLSRRRPGLALLLGALLCACDQAPAGTAPPTPEPPVQASPQTNWEKLFNGTDLRGWSAWFPSSGRGGDPRGVFKVEDGALHVLDLPPSGAEQEFGYLATDQLHKDYRLRLEYRWGGKKFAPRATEPRDAGLLYHVSGPDQIWPQGLEFQIMEGSTGDLWTLDGTNFSSTVQDANAAELQYDPLGRAHTTAFGDDSYKRLIRSGTPPEQAQGWNALELVVSGDQVVQIVGGQVAARASRLRGADGSPLTGGRILLQAEGAEVYYRAIELRPLAYTPPPAGATVLLGSGPGASAAAWQGRTGAPADWPVQDGAMTVRPASLQVGGKAVSNDIRTREAYGDLRLHLEFQLPVTPGALPEQDRGNSGVYLQGRYELQLLDSFGGALSGKNDLGAIYGQRDASSNAALPAGTWQTYDVEFRAARWQGGRKTDDARMTVWLNGEKVQDDVPLSASTFLGEPEADTPGPLVLQDHGNRVQFRNIWLLPR
ncbi:3-keto-disaccharide hydrolase [Deinococcus koreensis]|nr:DUF1080 domain-containing protein [Deinococcus koreensis]